MTSTALPAQSPRPVTGRLRGLSAQRRKPGLGRRSALVALAVYLAIAVLWNWRAVQHLGSACACGVNVDPGDNADFAWSFLWFPHAIAHGLPLLHPDGIWTPQGVDLGGTTASLFLALVAFPFTAVFGPIVAFNLVMIAAPITSALSAFILCRYLTRHDWASLLAGVVYGFSAFETTQLVGHPQMAVAFCPPLMVLCVVRFMSDQTSVRRFVTEFTVLLLVQTFISVEMLFITSVLGVVVLVAAVILLGAPRGRELVVKLAWLTVSVVITIALASWYLLALVRAPQYATGLGSIWPTDLLSLFVPMPYNWIGGSAFKPVSALFPSGSVETMAYLGVPLLLILIRFFVTRWSVPVTRVLAVAAVATVFWILGPHLYIAGHPTLWSPYSVIARWPGFTDVMHGRVAISLDLVGAVVLAMWLARPVPRAWVKWGAGIAAVAFVLPNLLSPSHLDAGTWTNPDFFKTAVYKRYIGRGETILPIPWGPQGTSMLWQAEDGFSWKLASGDWLLLPPPGYSGQLVSDLWSNTPRASDADDFRVLLRRHDVSDVVLQDRQVRVWGGILRVAGLRVSVKTGGVTIYRVPPSWRTPL